MLKSACREELELLLDKLSIVCTCRHAPEVEAEYEDNPGYRFRMCRECWDGEKYHKLDRDTVQIVRPNQLGVIVAKCMACDSKMDSCKCAA